MWRSWTPDKRRDALFRLADAMTEQSAELGVIGSLETGAPYSGYAWGYSAEWLRYYAGWADKITGESINAYPFPGIDYTKPEPVGVVAVFTASNGPSGFFGMSAAPALAAGCAIVVKPARARAVLVGHVRPTRARGGPPAGRRQRRERRR